MPHKIANEIPRNLEIFSKDAFPFITQIFGRLLLKKKISNYERMSEFSLSFGEFLLSYNDF